MKICLSCNQLLTKLEFQETTLPSKHDILELNCDHCKRVCLLFENNQLFYYKLLYYYEGSLIELISDKDELYTRIAYYNYLEDIFTLSEFFSLPLDNYYQEGEFLINKLLKLKVFS